MDLVPFKTCTYDCIYCQLGRTTSRTVERREYVPVEEVVAELRRRLDGGARPDHITLSGSGEPTLHSGMGRIIAAMKDTTDIPVAVLTNGSLLWRDEVVDAVRRADILLPSLDAGDAERFAHVNRPHESISFDEVTRGLIAVRDAFPGRIWLEVFLLAGVTANDADILKIRRIAERVRPDRVQLNTAVRPTAEDFAFAVSAEEMDRLSRLMGGRAEVIADFHGVHGTTKSRIRRDDALALIARRPCTLRDIASALDMHVNEASKYVGELEREGLIVIENHRGTWYCVAARDATGGPRD